MSKNGLFFGLALLVCVEATNNTFAAWGDLDALSARKSLESRAKKSGQSVHHQSSQIDAKTTRISSTMGNHSELNVVQMVDSKRGVYRVDVTGPGNQHLRLALSDRDYSAYNDQLKKQAGLRPAGVKRIRSPQMITVTNADRTFTVQRLGFGRNTHLTINEATANAD